MKAGASEELRLPASAAAWSAELRALLRLLRAALGTAPAEADWPADVTAAGFLACLSRHRIGAFLQHRLPLPARTGLPVEIQTELLAAAEDTARRALARSAELVRLARLLRTADVPFLSVKGPLLARALHGEAGARHAGDLDLLIPPERLAAADTALRAAGYRRSQPDFELTPRQWREYQRLKHEFEYFNDATQVRVEVEWRLEGLDETAFGPWWAAGLRESLGGEELVRLPAETESLYLFVHGAGHGWFRLFWLVDVALLLMREQEDWPALMRAAQAGRVERAVWQGAWLVERLLGIPTPEALRVPPGRKNQVGRLAREAMRLMGAVGPERQTVTDLLRQTRYQLCLRRGWPAKAAVLRPRLMSPANWKVLRLPDRWFPLYYLAAPWLWLRRRAGRR